MSMNTHIHIYIYMYVYIFIHSFSIFLLITIILLSTSPQLLSWFRDKELITDYPSALLGEVICHGPWESLYVLLVVPGMQGPDHSSPRPSLRIVFEIWSALLPFARSMVNLSSSIFLSCNATQCVQAFIICTSCLTCGIWGGGAGGVVNNCKLLEVLHIDFVMNSKILCLWSRSLIFCFDPRDSNKLNK